MSFRFIIAFLPLSLFSIILSADVYIILYATQDGKTGHIAIAIDDYDVVIRDSIVNGQTFYIEDTVQNGRIHYFDLWPKYSNIPVSDFKKDIEPVYHHFPERGKQFTIRDLYFSGLPNQKLLRKFDGLIRIPTSAQKDQKTMQYLEEVLSDPPPYNVRKNNCSDFVNETISFVIGHKIKAREFIPFYLSTTPNKLFRKLSKREDFELLLDPGEKVNGTFLFQRVLKKRKQKIEK